MPEYVEFDFLKKVLIRCSMAHIHTHESLKYLSIVYYKLFYLFLLLLYEMFSLSKWFVIMLDVSQCLDKKFAPKTAKKRNPTNSN